MKKIKRLRINLLLNYPLGVELAFLWYYTSYFSRLLSFHILFYVCVYHI